MKMQWRGKKSYYKWCLKVPYVAYIVLLGNIDSLYLKPRFLLLLAMIYVKNLI